MSTLREDLLSALYLEDETAWLEHNAALIRQGRLAEVDYDHLAEYLDDMSRRDRREVKSRLAVLLAHRLKWQFQPEKRSRSWLSTIITQRQELDDLVSSGVLRAYAFEVLGEAYANAVAIAAAETGMDGKAFPAENPFSLEDLMTTDLDLRA
jgi:hypothetical protein